MPSTALSRPLFCLVILFVIWPRLVSAQPQIKTDDATFELHVMSVLSKAGCNSGACHGNLKGKGGLRLSLRGQDPRHDYLAITHDLGSRRINRVEPSESLILLKPSAAAPHEGGQRFQVGSLEHRILANWIGSGAPPPSDSAPLLIGLTVSPAEQTVHEPTDSIQLRVIAKFDNGMIRDVTRLSTFETTNFAISVSPDGKVHRKAFGESQVIVRFLSLQMPARIAFLQNRPFEWQQPVAANVIDRHIFAKLKSLRLNPEPVSADHVFIRRVYLDVLGILPSASVAREFVDDQDPYKRQRLIDRVLARPEFADHWAQKWCDLLRVEERLLDPNGTKLFHAWIRDCFATGKPLNEFAAEILSAAGSTYKVPQTNFYRALRDPLERGETIARVFLGYRLQCAKCHNHPFDHWTQDDYYSWAACFAKVDYKVIENKRPDKLDKSLFYGEQIVQRNVKQQVKNARTGKKAAAKVLNEQRNSIDENGSDQLIELAKWMSGDNRQFAAAQVNRIWFHLLGRGLVEPIDDFRITNPASHPQLLTELTDELIRCQFDVRHLIRLILNSRTYQTATGDEEAGPLAIENFATNRVRRLAAEQLLDAQCQVLNVSAKFDGYATGIRAGQLPGIKKQFRGKPTRDDRFLEKFGKPARNMSCECERSDEPNLSQVFMLLSDKQAEQRLNDETNLIFQLSRSPRSKQDIVSELYWHALSRPPSRYELEYAIALLKNSADSYYVLQDLVWALMNSKEFVFRH